MRIWLKLNKICTKNVVLFTYCIYLKNMHIFLINLKVLLRIGMTIMKSRLNLLVNFLPMGLSTLRAPSILCRSMGLTPGHFSSRYLTSVFSMQMTVLQAMPNTSYSNGINRFRLSAGLLCDPRQVIWTHLIFLNWEKWRNGYQFPSCLGDNWWECQRYSNPLINRLLGKNILIPAFKNINFENQSYLLLQHVNDHVLA